LLLALHAEGLVVSAHDCSDGGLAVTLAESAILGTAGFAGSAGFEGRLDAALFGEAQGRIVVSIMPDTFRQGGGAARLEDLARSAGVPVARLGQTTESSGFTLGPIQSTVAQLLEAYETGI
jgi:phosphoribosylformylglycinamidine synthase